MECYTWNTPNGQKPSIILEELALDYTIVTVDIDAGEQDDPNYRKINPNGNIPSLRDGDLTVFESGAILHYLAEKHGRFLPADGQARLDAMAWTFWQVGGLGPMIGQRGHFLNADGDHDYAAKRYLGETLRLYDVLEARLTQADYLAGADYTIADMMAWPWASGGFDFLDKQANERVGELSATRDWCENIRQRAAN